MVNVQANFCLTCPYSIGRDPNGTKPAHPIHVWCTQHLCYKRPDEYCEVGQV